MHTVGLLFETLTPQPVEHIIFNVVLKDTEFTGACGIIVSKKDY